MKKAVGLFLLIVGVSSYAMAAHTSVPEIDPAGAVNAVALISGALLILRGRRRK